MRGGFRNGKRNMVAYKLGLKKLWLLEGRIIQDLLFNVIVLSSPVHVYLKVWAQLFSFLMVIGVAIG